MIYCYIKGRLGNQMFYYAMARMLGIASSHEFIFNFKEVLALHSQENDGFEDSLKYFNVKGYKTVNERMTDAVLKHGSVRQKINFLAYLCCLKLLN